MRDCNYVNVVVACNYFFGSNIYTFDMQFCILCKDEKVNEWWTSIFLIKLKKIVVPIIEYIEICWKSPQNKNLAKKSLFIYKKKDVFMTDVSLTF